MADAVIVATARSPIGAIALSHPFGMTGARITATLALQPAPLGTRTVTGCSARCSG